MREREEMELGNEAEGSVPKPELGNEKRTLPGQKQGRRGSFNASTQNLPLPVQGVAEPADVGGCGSGDLEFPHPGRYEPQLLQPSVQGVDVGEVHQSEVAAIFPVAADPLVVGDEIAAAIDDQFLPVHFHPFYMMG